MNKGWIFTRENFYVMVYNPWFSLGLQAVQPYVNCDINGLSAFENVAM
jgi:hypothetical protein